MADIHAEKILVLDFGSQYTQLIARRIRELHVYCEIHPCTMPFAEVRAFAAKGIVLSGGPASVEEPGAPMVDPRIFELGVPVLGVCYGLQLMAKLLGGAIDRTAHREYGPARVEVTEAVGPFRDMTVGEHLDVWMSHGDKVSAPPKGFRTIAKNPSSPFCAVADPHRKLYGIQFHPEVAHTPRGRELYEAFLEECGVSFNFRMGAFAEDASKQIRERVGKERREHGDARFLAQGTLYPDVIESVSFKGPSAVIKSHHNVGGLPERMKMQLVEPLRELFKDEVRALGRELGLPEAIVSRQPFPGPGLAIRVLGEVTEERLALIRKADAIVQEEVANAGLREKLWQAFAVLLPVKSVGVMGDERTYESACVLRAVESLDGMTADWARLPWDLVARISSRITNEVRGINRVVLDVSSKPPATIEWE